MGFRRFAVALCMAAVFMGSASSVDAHRTGDECSRLGSKTRISGVRHTCVAIAQGKLVWRHTKKISPPTPTVAVATPSVSLEPTTFVNLDTPQIVTVVANSVGIVYFIEGATPVNSVVDITSADSSRWAKGSIVSANVPTRIVLDVANITNGYYRVYLASSGGKLSAPATNLVTISVPRGGAPVASLSCADGGACAIGDIGPGGGVVFILTTTAGNTTGRTFEAAPKNWDGGAQDGTAQWCAASDASVSGLGTAIGTGSTNSSSIATTCTSSGRDDAAQYVRGKTIGGKSDWFLPSRDEALEIYNQRTVFTGAYAINATNVDTARYLTSSQDSDYSTGLSNAIGAYLQGSGFPGTAQGVSKSFAFSIRPVRSFVAG